MCVKIANIGPATYNYDETISTLRYANRAKNIKNVARVNEDPKDALLRKFQQEIEQLRRQLDDVGEHRSACFGSLKQSSVSIDNSADSDGDDDADEAAIAAAGGGSNWDERIREMERNIDERRKQLNSERGLAESERRRYASELMAAEEELAASKAEHERLQSKLASIERTLIVGGENLLEKAEQQAKLLADSNM